MTTLATNGCYSNYKLFNIPITLDGLSFEKDNIVFTLHQPDKYDVESKYFTVFNNSYKQNNMSILAYLSNDIFLAKATNGSYNNYKLFNIPIALDGLNFSLEDISFTLHQPDKYDVDSKYFTVTTGVNEYNLYVIKVLSDDVILAKATDGCYSNYKLFSIPVSIKGLTFMDNDITYTVIQNNLKTPADVYLKPTCNGDARVQMFKILIDNNFKYANIPVNVDGEILADGLGGEAVFTFHQDSNDCSNVWITVSAGNDGSLVTAFRYVKEYFPNGLLFDRVPIKMEGLTIQNLGYNYVYHEATSTKGEYWSVSVDIPDEASTEESKAIFMKYTKENVEEYLFDIPVEIIFN